MGRAPCCDKANVKKGPWSPEEDAQLKEYIEKYGTGGNWIALPQKAGLRRCGKSCRLRWLNYLRPNIKHGEFSDDEDRIICTLYANIGSRWSIIAAQLPGRTDNDIKNYWNTKLKKKLMGFGHLNNPSHRSSSKPHGHQHQHQLFTTSFAPILQNYSSAPPPPPPPLPPSLSTYSYAINSPTDLSEVNNISYSCSSSEGSFSNANTSTTQLPSSLQSFPSFYGVEDSQLVQDQMWGSSGENEIINRNVNDLPSDYYYGEIEEIKNLISSCSNNSCSSNIVNNVYSNSGGNFLFDENKSGSLGLSSEGKKCMYYY